MPAFKTYYGQRQTQESINILITKKCSVIRMVIFMPPDRMIGGILFLSALSVCLFVCLFVCLSVCLLSTLTFTITFEP